MAVCFYIRHLQEKEILCNTDYVLDIAKRKRNLSISRALLALALIASLGLSIVANFQVSLSL